MDGGGMMRWKISLYTRNLSRYSGAHCYTCSANTEWMNINPVICWRIFSIQQEYSMEEDD